MSVLCVIASMNAAVIASPFFPIENVLQRCSRAMTPGSGVDGVVSRNGTLVYVSGAASLNDERMLVWVDRQGREEIVPAPLRTYQMARLSPDGTHVALDVRDEDNDIWIWAFAPKTLTRLTSVPGNDMFPVWTSDSRRVIFSAAPDSKGQRLLAWRLADGSAAAEALVAVDESTIGLRRVSRRLDTRPGILGQPGYPGAASRWFAPVAGVFD